MDWQHFWNGTTAVATVAATGISAVVGLAFRWFDKQRVAWVVFGAEAKWQEHDSWTEGPLMQAELANVGDGTALAVKVVGLGCHVELRGPLVNGTHRSWRDEYELRPAMRSGDEVHLIVWCDPRDWGRAEVVITWIPSPSVRRVPRAWREPLRRAHVPPRHSRFAQDETTGLETEAPTGDEPADPLPPERQPQLPLPPTRWDLAGRWKLRLRLRRR